VLTLALNPIGAFTGIIVIVIILFVTMFITSILVGAHLLCIK